MGRRQGVGRTALGGGTGDAGWGWEMGTGALRNTQKRWGNGFRSEFPRNQLRLDGAREQE